MSTYAAALTWIKHSELKETRNCNSQCRDNLFKHSLTAVFVIYNQLGNYLPLFNKGS